MLFGGKVLVFCCFFFPVGFGFFIRGTRGGGTIVLQMKTRESYRLGKGFYHPAVPQPISSLITKFKMRGGEHTEKVRQQT